MSIFELFLAIFPLSLMFFAMGSIYFYYHSKRNALKLQRQNDLLSANFLNMQNEYEMMEELRKDDAQTMKVIVHDLRSSVSGMMSAASLMLMEDERPENDIQLLELIKESGSNSSLLIHEILNDSPSKQLEKQEVDLFKILQWSTSLLQFEADKKSQRIVLKGKSTFLLLNKGKIQRVVNNLIANAIKFSYAETQIIVDLDVIGNEVIVSVIDFGIGISASNQDTIFDYGGDFKRVGTGDEKSYGMGLGISKKIIQDHGGRIWLDKNEAGGSVFSFALLK